MKKLATILTVLSMVFSFSWLTQPAMACDGALLFGETIETNILTNCADDDGEGSAIFCLLNMAVDILTAGITVVAVVGMMVAAVQYLTARDNESQVTKAKNRILQIVIGLIVYYVAYAALRWLIPGFNV